MQVWLCRCAIWPKNMAASSCPKGHTTVLTVRVAVVLVGQYRTPQSSVTRRGECAPFPLLRDIHVSMHLFTDWKSISCQRVALSNEDSLHARQ